MFGTRPVPPGEAARTLAELQAQIVAASRFGIPAVAHEECLTGFAAWTATIFPTPLAWGATFDPGLVGEMAAAIGASMAGVGIHQGLAPVLDVTRDRRWGRTEETIGEDPYLVGPVGTAYVRGLQSAGIAGHAEALRRVLGVARGPEHGPGGHRAARVRRRDPGAVRDGAAARRGEVGDAVLHRRGRGPGVADRTLLTGLLRDELGFDGLVVSDYYAIAFLQTQHAVASTPAQAAALALDAGLDVELPNVACYGAALVTAVREGQVPAELVDRAAARVLRQKCELGLLDPGWSPSAAAGTGRREVPIDLDPPAHRALARRLAEESVVLLANRDASLPLRPDASIAVVGPLADDPLAFFGCYSMPRHLGGRYAEAVEGPAVTTVLDALRAELPAAEISYEAGAPSAARTGPGSRTPSCTRQRRTWWWPCSGTRPGCSAGAPRARAAT